MPKTQCKDPLYIVLEAQVLTRKDFITSAIDIESDSEMIFIDLKLKNQQNVKIGCVYRPPWSDEEYMNDLGKVLDQIDPHHKGNIWIGGDFNLPKIDSLE